MGLGGRQRPGGGGGGSVVNGPFPRRRHLRVCRGRGQRHDALRGRSRRQQPGEGSCWLRVGHVSGQLQGLLQGEAAEVVEGGAAHLTGTPGVPPARRPFQRLELVEQEGGEARILQGRRDDI